MITRYSGVKNNDFMDFFLDLFYKFISSFLLDAGALILYNCYDIF